MDDLGAQLARAAQIVAHAGLVDAFGHVSVRASDALVITAPTALAFQTPQTVVTLPLHASTLAAGVPKEAWIHLALARADAATGAIVRAQPRAVAQAIAARRTIRARDGQGALLGDAVPVYDDSRLIRDSASGDAVARAIGAAPAIILRGNGAVTRGATLAQAVARMWLLERSAELALAAEPASPALPTDEQDWWRERDSELLDRIYDYLVHSHEARP